MPHETRKPPQDQDTGRPRLPVRAGPGRRALHALIALAGWVLFVYWWWLVARRVSEHEIRFTMLVIGIALGVILLLTGAWVLHNIQIFRVRGPRLHLRPVVQDFSHDTVGRDVQFPAVPADCLSAAVVNVRIHQGGKVYVPEAPTGGSPAPAGGAEAAR